MPRRPGKRASNENRGTNAIRRTIAKVRRLRVYHGRTECISALKLRASNLGFDYFFVCATAVLCVLGSTELAAVVRVIDGTFAVCYPIPIQMTEHSEPVDVSRKPS